MIKADKVARGRTCVCGALIPQGETCVVEITGSGKWTRKRSLCRTCGTQAIIKERDKVNKIEIAVYGEDGG
jgi:hypothetical protein